MTTEGWGSLQLVGVVTAHLTWSLTDYTLNVQQGRPQSPLIQILIAKNIMKLVTSYGQPTAVGHKILADGIIFWQTLSNCLLSI